MRSDRRARAVVITLLLSAFIANSLSYLPLPDPARLLLRIASLPLAITALLIVMTTKRRDNETTRSRWSTWMAVAAAFTAGALAWGTLAPAAWKDADAARFALELDAPTQSLSTVSVSTQTIDLNDKELADRALDDAAAKAEQFVDITGIQADKLVAGAHAAGYEPRSGLIPEWAQASVQSFGGWQLVTVPLSGTDLPELSKVTYFKMGDSAEVVEWAASLTADNTVSVDGWQNGQKFREALFVIEGANQDGASITSVGLNQKKLERCLTANGMPQWIVTTIFSVCTAVCIFTLGVGCIVCISAWAGANSAIIYDCVKRAWT